MEWSVTRKLLREESSQLYLFDVQPDPQTMSKPAVSDEEIYRIAANHTKSPEQLLTEINWDFSDSVTQYLTHKFHSYPARFIPQIPCTAIKICLEEGKSDDIVFDIFCGCGTTLVEAILAGKNAIGIDINPLAVLLAKAKTKRIAEDDLRTSFQSIISEVHRRIDYTRLRDYSEVEDWNILLHILPKHIVKPQTPEYQAHVEHYKSYLLKSKHEAQIHINAFYLLSLIRDSIEACTRPTGSDVSNNRDDIRNFFLIALSSVVNRLKNSQAKEISDNVLPLTFFSQISEGMIYEMEDFYTHTSAKNHATIYEADSRYLQHLIPENHIDLVVTSPPYPNALDYHREHKENLLWLGLPFRNFQNNEIGAHSKFASNRFRMLSQYLADMLKSMSEICRVLKPGKYAWVVIGNSSVEHVIIDNHIFFAMMGELAGMPLQAQILRNINKGKKYTSKNIGNIDDEYVMLFQKKDYIPPKPDLIEKMVCAVLSDLREQLINDTLPYDEKVLASSVKRFFKRKNLSLKEAKSIYRERNIEKLDKVILNIPTD